MGDFFQKDGPTHDKVHWPQVEVRKHSPCITPKVGEHKDHLPWGWNTELTGVAIILFRLEWKICCKIFMSAIYFVNQLLFVTLSKSSYQYLPLNCCIFIYEYTILFEQLIVSREVAAFWIENIISGLLFEIKICICVVEGTNGKLHSISSQARNHRVLTISWKRNKLCGKVWTREKTSRRLLKLPSSVISNLKYQSDVKSDLNRN